MASNGVTPLQQVADLSIQNRALPNPEYPGFFSFVTSQDSVTDFRVSDWWSPRRDVELREFVKLKGNDILQGAITSLVKKFVAMSWSVVGPKGFSTAPGTAAYFQRLLSEAEFGKGWSSLLTKTIQDYLQCDNGAFWELIGHGPPNGPLSFPGVLGIAHLDSARCTLTGDLEFPVIFRDAKDKSKHKLHHTRVVHFVDSESSETPLRGVGFCAVSRILKSSEIILKIGKYKSEKLSDMPESGVMLMNNIFQRHLEDARLEYDSRQRQRGNTIWRDVLTLFGVDPAKPATMQFVSFANLPEAFDELQSTNIYVNIVALALGIDPREIWPVSSGPLGTGTETLIQHQKARGKGIGEVISTLERGINWHVLSRNSSFNFDFVDDEEDLQRANIDDKKVTTIMRMWRPATAAQINDPFFKLPVERDEIRRMLADNVSYFKPQFLEGNVTTPDITGSDTVRITNKGIVTLEHSKRSFENYVQYVEKYYDHCPV